MRSLLLALLFVLSLSTAQAQSLYTFDLKAAAASNPDQAAIVRDTPLGREALRIQGREGGRAVSLNTQGAPWADARYLVADVYHANPYSTIFEIRFFSKDDTAKERISMKTGTLPQLHTQVILPLEHLDGQTFFLPRQVRQLKAIMSGHRLSPDRITKIELAISPVSSGFTPEVLVANLRLTRDMPAPLPKAEPIVDELGQWRLRDWPGKTKSADEMVAELKRLESTSTQTTFPENWSQYGGWKEKRFRATGFFRAENDGHRWWLVDPEGYAFFSVGVDVSTSSSPGPLKGMEDLYAWLPPKEGVYAAAWGNRQDQPMLSMQTANLVRAFGADWENAWRRLTRGLLVGARFNTIGNWSDLRFARSARMPYVIPLNGFPSTNTRLYRDFPDVFSPEYQANSERFARQMEQYRDDRYLIGYFLSNEPVWGFGDNIIASEMLSTTEPSYSRTELVKWLKQKYSNIAALSGAWKHNFRSFDDFEKTAILDAWRFSETAEKDLRAFSNILAERYIRIPSEAIRKVDTNHMNLGIRYSSISSELCYQGAQYVDVFSLNAYEDRPNEKTIMEINRRSGKPVMIGEFHHGAIDRGLPSTGIKGVVSQADRGAAYRYYIEQGAAIPALVGMHFFQLNDQPLTGRFDGENYNIGLVDVCNLPYRELTDAATKTNAIIYEVAAGRVQPFAGPVKRMPAIFF